MNIDWPLLLFFLAFPVTLGVVVWLFWMPYAIAKKRGISFIPIYYIGALTLGTPVVGWIVAMIYVTTTTPQEPTH